MVASAPRESCQWRRDDFVIRKQGQTQVSKLRDSSHFHTQPVSMSSRCTSYAPKTDICLLSLSTLMKYLLWHEIIQPVFKSTDNIYLTVTRNAKVDSSFQHAKSLYICAKYANALNFTWLQFFYSRIMK